MPYHPEQLWKPHHLLETVPTAWDGCPDVLRDIMLRFKIKPNTALEFGVFCGYSTAALANFFNRVIGVDTFMGDVYAGFNGNHESFFEQTKNALKDYKNVELFAEDYREFISHLESDMVQDLKYDLIHVDIIHDYQPTNECVAWAVQHSDVTLVHDTIAFPEVRRAVQDVCWETGVVFYEWQVKHGLGILVRE